MHLLSFRLRYFLGFIVCGFLLGMGIYLQTHDGINPCPLCILQRITFGILGIIFFIGFIIPFKKIGRAFITSLALLFTSLGALLAGRQIWLQHLPSTQSGDCGASLQYMLQVLPVNEVLKKVFVGSAECSHVDWQFWNISLAEWSFICFIGLLLLSLWQSCRVTQK